MRKLTANEFIEKSRNIYFDKYDYSLVIYEHSKSRVKIICPIHGVFEQIPNTHLNGNGCKKCGADSRGDKSRLSNEDFITRANLIHKNKYDYSLTSYKNRHANVKIICSVHGVFEQAAKSHINGRGCNKCLGFNKNSQDFILEAKNVHGDKYDYSLLEYVDSSTKIKIICLIHGVFEQMPHNHINSNGCLKCGIASTTKKQTLNNEIFINKANFKHKNKYDYSLVEYIGYESKIKILCSKHGIFEQTPHIHLRGLGSGCPICNESKGEKQIKEFLHKHNIKLIQQQKFADCKLKNELPFDFYLPDYNTCIEFNGRQHYDFPNFFVRTEKAFKLQQLRDKIKMEYCYVNNIPLIIIKYDENIEKVLKLKLLLPC